MAVVHVNWEFVGDPNEDAGCDVSRVLYAYLHPRTLRPVYIGKAWGTTVAERWDARDKLNGVWPFLNSQGIKKHAIAVGDLSFTGRLTRELLSDVESLMIFAEQPIANIASTKSRISRPGLIVRNAGPAWTGKHQQVRDYDGYVELYR